MRLIFTLCSVICLGVVMAGCSSQTGSGTLPSRATFLSQPSGGYEAIRSFRGGDYGSVPTGSLVMMNGTLYGTTGQGGGIGAGLGWGTVFTANKTGRGRVLYRFGGGSDGWAPGSLTALNGTLYGTTSNGGASGSYGLGFGTFFSLSKSGAHRVLYDFAGGADGAHPLGNLVVVDGVFYGVTVGGAGTVFAIDASGKERVIYRFQSGGWLPAGGLTYLDGALYGVTTYGGNKHCFWKRGCGTIFKLSLSGSAQTLYAFRGGSQGEYPTGSLLTVRGKLYGTTADNFRPPNGCGPHGCGTIFEATTSGKVRILYHFKGGPSDGAWPTGSLAYVNGMIFGTTRAGGNTSCDRGSGSGDCGTVFSVTTSGVEHVLHMFSGTPDGGEPARGLLAANNALYGATFFGGNNDAGTLFKISP